MAQSHALEVSRLQTSATVKPSGPALEVIIPNLHWRYSGVTATNRMVGAHIARLVPTSWLGSNRPDSIAPISWTGVLALRFRRRPSDKTARPAVIWHARRNNEMIVGVALRALGWPLELVFTSAGQRKHSWITRLLMRRMNAVIATSEQSAAFLTCPATVIHHGVDCDTYAPPADRAAAFAATGLPGKFGIGCFGRVRKQKGTDVFVDALCQLLPRYPDFTAVIVGAVTAEHQLFVDELKSRAAAAGLTERIRFLGELPIEEVPLWYQRISLFAFTSRNEGFGLTLIEAMATGNALVAARAGAAESVVVDPSLGILVPPGDPAALASALETLMTDMEAAATMGRRAREHVLRFHSIDTEAAQIVAVYREAVARRV
jgi:mannosyltransferase